MSPQENAAVGNTVVTVFPPCDTLWFVTAGAGLSSRQGGGRQPRMQRWTLFRGTVYLQ